MEIALGSNLTLTEYYKRGVQAIIRPPKNSYPIEKLGPLFFSLKNGRKFKRIDQRIPHGQDMLELTMYLPFNQQDPTALPLNLILFCHCNASNRLQCLQYIDFLPPNYGIAGFDFLGCGNTRETYVSLGLRESSQIRTIINSISPQFKRVIPWGRSMGATSVLMYGQAPISVVDSPFCSLKSLGKDISQNVESNKCLLACLFPCLWGCIKSSVKKKADFNMSQVNPSNNVKNMSTNQAIIFIASKNDELVPHTHAQKLYKQFPSQKKALLLVDGDHNTLRRKETFDQVLSLIDKYSGQSGSMTSLSIRADHSSSVTSIR